MDGEWGGRGEFLSEMVVGDKWSSLYIRKLYIWFHKLTYLMR